MHFWSFSAKYWPFLPFFSMRDQKPMWTRCLGGFSVKWVTKLLISPLKKGIFCPKTSKFGLKLAFLFILGQALPAHLVPCWWVGWWYVSRKTPIYFMYSLDCDFTDSNDEVSTVTVRKRCLRLYHWVMNRKCRVRQAGGGGDYLERIYHFVWRWDRSIS